jgi:diguanylate cyclase (GGDEF)-like protein
LLVLLKKGMNIAKDSNNQDIVGGNMEDINHLNKTKVLKLAEKYASLGKIQAAINEYEKVIKLDPNAFTTINTLGDLYVRVGRNEEAKDIFLRIAKSYCENGFTLKAIAMYKKLYKLSPNNYEIPLKIADLYANHGLIVEAKQWYFTIADLLKKQGETRKTLEVYKKVVEVEPDNVVLWLKMAEGYNKEGFSCEAHDAFMQAGRIFFQEMHTADAVQAYQKALAIYPHSKPAIKSLVYAFMQNNELKKALLLLSQSLEKSPDDIDLLTLLGRTCLNANLIDDAESAFSYLLELDESRYGYLLEVGNRLLKSNQLDRVLSIIDRCADLVIKDKQEKKIISLLNALLEIDRVNVKSMEKLAYTYSKINEKDLLIVTLKKLADEALRQGLKEKATSALNRIIELEFKLVSVKAQPASADISQVDRPVTEQFVEPFEEVHTKELDSFTEHPVIEHFEITDQAGHKPDGEHELIDLDELLDHPNFYHEPHAELEEMDLSNLLFDRTSDNTKEPAESISVLPFGGNQEEIHDRKFFNIILDREWRRAMRSTSPISLILINIAPLISNQESQNAENFLIQVAIELTKTVKRGGDLVAIYSRSEIAVLLPEVSERGAAVVAKRLHARMESIRSAIEGSPMKRNASIEIGIATDIPQRNSSADILMSAVRRSLCQVKHAMKNLTISQSLHSVKSA